MPSDTVAVKALQLTYNTASTAIMSHLCTERICHVCDVHFVTVVQTAEGYKYSRCASAVEGRMQRVPATPRQLVESVH